MVWKKRLLCMVIICVTIVNCFAISAGAVEGDSQQYIGISARATGEFKVEVPGQTAVEADVRFPLEVGEVVTIKASYSPFYASVDFGLIAPDGLFYSVTVTGGSVDQAIRVSQRGNYTLAIENHSNQTIRVSGYVNY